jgi:ketosteroid isomerase-like protein
MSVGNVASLIEALDENVSWTVAGTTKHSGTFLGKNNVLNNLVSEVEGKLKAPVKMSVKRVIAEGNYVVVESAGTATTVSGHSYQNAYCEVYKVINKRITEVIIYLDTAAVESLL